MTSPRRASIEPVTDDPSSGLRIISYGGGVQSTAMLVLAATGRLGRVDAVLFCNVGDDSEHPATLRYVREIATPWAAERGITVTTLHRVNTRGAYVGPETLYERLMRPGSRSLPIPVRMADTGAPGTRSCTADFKIAPIGRWLKANGATADTPAEVLIGISTDEIERAGRGRDEPYERRRYPLLDLGLSRADCAETIKAAGLPVPPKSSCYFCPYHRPSTWAEMRRDEPELFERSQAIEDHLNGIRRTLSCPVSGTPAVVLDRIEADADDPDDGAEYVERSLVPGSAEVCPRCRATHTITADGRWPDHHKSLVYLTRFGKRLSDAVPEAQASLFAHDGPGEDGCDSGHCWT